VNLDEELQPTTEVVPTRWLGRCLVIGIVLAVGLAAWLWWDTEAFFEWKREAGLVPFFGALAVLPAFGVPTTPFYILAGATFGVGVGIAGSAISLALNLLLCYWIARSGLRKWLERALARTKYRLPQVGDGRVIRFALLVKFTPGAPTFIKTYLIAIAGVPFWVYFLLSYVVTMAYATGFIVLGEGMFDRDLSQAIWALVILLVLGAVVWFGRRWWQRKNAEV
jgi:uncharacterized membrane protein YdjX (TVP38/TMEM64 family)